MCHCLNRSWTTVLKWLQKQNFYETYFLPVPKNETWRDARYLESADDRFPSDLLDTTEADTLFRNHTKALRSEQRRQE